MSNTTKPALNVLHNRVLLLLGAFLLSFQTPAFAAFNVVRHGVVPLPDFLLVLPKPRLSTKSMAVAPLCQASANCSIEAIQAGTTYYLMLNIALVEYDSVIYQENITAYFDAKGTLVAYQGKTAEEVMDSVKDLHDKGDKITGWAGAIMTAVELAGDTLDMMENAENGGQENLGDIPIGAAYFDTYGGFSQGNPHLDDYDDRVHWEAANMASQNNDSESDPDVSETPNTGHGSGDHHPPEPSNNTGPGSGDHHPESTTSSGGDGGGSGGSGSSGSSSGGSGAPSTGPHG